MNIVKPETLRLQPQSQREQGSGDDDGGGAMESNAHICMGLASKAVAQPTRLCHSPQGLAATAAPRC